MPVKKLKIGGFCLLQLISLLLMVVTPYSLASAQETADEIYAAPMRAYINSTVRTWLQDPIIIDAIREQNIANENISQSKIDELDAQWRQELEGGTRPLINGVMKKDISQFLAEKQRESGDLLLEIFVMDAKGLNVGQSRPTSDYWQGDEAKWIKTYQVGPDAMFIADIDIDDSTLNFQSQASMTIADPDTLEAIGAITLGFNFEKL